MYTTDWWQYNYFSDDTALILKSKAWVESFHRVELLLGNIKQWLDDNLLTLYITKSKYLIISLNKPSQPSINRPLKKHTCKDFTSCLWNPLELIDFITYILGINSWKLRWEDLVINFTNRIQLNKNTLNILYYQLYPLV